MTTAEQTINRRKKQKEIGGCCDCMNIAAPGRTRCLKCLELDNTRTSRYKERCPEKRIATKRRETKYRRENNLCHGCGTPLDASIDSERTCINCNQGLYNEGH